MSTFKEDLSEIGKGFLQTLGEEFLGISYECISQVAMVEAQDLAIYKAQKDIIKKRAKDPNFRKVARFFRFITYLEQTGEYTPEDGEFAEDYIDRIIDECIDKEGDIIP